MQQAALLEHRESGLAPDTGPEHPAMPLTIQSRRKNPGKLEKLDNGRRPAMAEKWPPKWKKWRKNGPNPIFGSIRPFFLRFFPFRRPFSGHFRPGTIFHFLSHSPDFCAGPVSDSVDGHRRRKHNLVNLSLRRSPPTPEKTLRVSESQRPSCSTPMACSKIGSLRGSQGAERARSLTCAVCS